MYVAPGVMQSVVHVCLNGPRRKLVGNDQRNFVFLPAYRLHQRVLRPYCSLLHPVQRPDIQTAVLSYDSSIWPKLAEITLKLELTYDDYGRKKMYIAVVQFPL